MAHEFPESVRKPIHYAINSGGFGFQYAALRAAKDACERGRSRWVFQAAEFPVATRSHETRIDFVLSDSASAHFLAVECKRVSSAQYAWAFARAPLVRRDRAGEPLLVDVATRTGSSSSLEVRACMGRDLSDLACHVGFVVPKFAKPGEAGAVTGRPRESLNEAITQAIIGVNGLINHWADQPTARVRPNATMAVMPCIFTTADVLLCTAALDGADVNTGNVDAEQCNIRQVPYVFLQHHVSRRMKHDHERPWSATDLARSMDLDSVRTIAIVSAEHIGSFLRWFEVGILEDIAA